DYLPIIKKKVGISKKSLFDKECKFEILRQKTKKILPKITTTKKKSSKKSLINNRINNPNYWKSLKKNQVKLSM
ncbi:hypothetical protein B6D52_01610, partial [Candidatus Parcubacteria bacterium 4484_255]